MKKLMVTWLVCAMALTANAAPEKKQTDKSDERSFAESFGEDSKDLVSTGRNPFFILEPGFVLEYAGEEDGEKATLIITVLDETKKVDGVETRIVEEKETANGEVIEISRNYFAISRRTNSVYYFGEDSRKYKDGKVVSHEGSWESGAKGAHYGLMMPAPVLPGARFYQEIAPGEAMDRAEIISVSETLKVPAGEFKNCLKTEETTPLEPGNKEYKYYAPGVGLIKDGDLTLVSHGNKNKAGKAD